MPAASTEVAIRLRGLRKVFPGSPPIVAVEGADLEIGDGEFFSMLGPSGSGKTTVLRMIAGFEEPTSGTVELGGRDVTGRPAYDRDVNTVFQDYALFPHLSVLENVEYGLRVKKVARDERRLRAMAAIGTATEIYERPTSAFVAGFVGTSNMLHGEASEALFGRTGSNSIRPEKLRLLPAGGAVADGERSADGRIGAGLFTIIVGHATFCMFRPNQAPVVNVVAVVLVLVSILPVWAAQRLGDNAAAESRL